MLLSRTVTTSDIFLCSRFHVGVSGIVDGAVGFCLTFGSIVGTISMGPAVFGR
jgi:hypothetical protein